MHESEERGKLILNGHAMPDEALCRILGLDKQILTTTLTTLLTYGVASRCDKSGAIICRRMIRDENLRKIRAEAGKLGGNPALLKQKTTTLVKQKQTPSSSSSSSISVSSTQEENMSADADESDFFSQAEITPKKETVSSEGATFAHWFRDTLPEKTNMPDRWEKSFAQTYDDLVRLDGRNPDEIRRVCQWARTDSFWASNFQSPAKLRKRNKDGIQYYDVFLEKAYQTKRTVQKGMIENIPIRMLE